MSLIDRIRFSLKASNTFYPILKRNLSKGGGGTVTNKATQLCIEGYPSSANSFCYHLFKCLLPELNYSHHTHSFANISLALKYNIPSLILIRNPLDCISSRVARFENNAQYCLIEYLDFYQRVQKVMSSEHILLIEFGEMINQTEEVLLAFDKHLIWETKSENTEELIKRAKTRMKNSQQKLGKRMDNVSLPNKERQAKKNEIKQKVKSFPEYKLSEDIYHSLIQSSVLKSHSEN